MSRRIQVAACILFLFLASACNRRQRDNANIANNDNVAAPTQANVVSCPLTEDEAVHYLGLPVRTVARDEVSRRVCGMNETGANAFACGYETAENGHIYWIAHKYPTEDDAQSAF